MNPGAIVLRETLLSMAINVAITLAFFFAMFGLSGMIVPRDFAFDFLPQSFMVALMGTIIPGVLIGRKGKAPLQPIVLRALGLALASLAIGGGGAYLLFANGAPIAPATGLAIKVIYSAVLSAIVTPIAVRGALAAPALARGKP
ncbi:hypothetical protein ACFSGX_03350 [Sphingomonas arantia]|uniref:Uncharacterized protein n=1 Tax=Sphingomonas arantia TaxID=1460676 RepID=A0ABW4TUU0_9SPHN